MATFSGYRIRNIESDQVYMTDPSLFRDSASFSPPSTAQLPEQNPATLFGWSVSITRNPLTPQKTTSGYLTLAYKQYYYNEIKVIPDLVNIGRLLANFSTTIEVWNAYIEEDKTLAQITGPTVEESGITLTPNDGDPPTFYPALQSKFHNLFIDFDGPPSANATYTFDFSTEDGILRVVGYRLIMFPYVPQGGYVERFIWLTDVIESFDGSEQFVKVRPTPRRELLYDYKGANTLGRGRFYNLLSSSIAYEVGVPIWQQARNLTDTTPAGSTRLFLDTARMEFEVGKPGFVFQNDGQSESFEVSAITATYIDAAAPFESTYDTDAQAMPVLICDMPKSISSNLYALNATDLRMQFQGKESTDLGTTSLTDQYKSLDVLHDCPEIQGRTLTWIHEGNWQDIDFATGLSEHDYPVQYAKTTRSFRKTFQYDPVGVWNFKQWLYKIAGRQGKFWIPEYSGSIEIVGTVPAVSFEVDIVNIALTQAFENTPFVTDIEFEFINGAIHRSGITGVIAKNTSVETITIDNSYGSDFSQADIKQISLLHQVRLDNDTVEFQFESKDICTVQFNTREVIN